jgi:hypothetical protein
MKIELCVICTCGATDEKDFIEMDSLDFTSATSYREFLCKQCKRRIIVEKPKK